MNWTTLSYTGHHYIHWTTVWHTRHIILIHWTVTLDITHIHWTTLLYTVQPYRTLGNNLMHWRTLSYPGQRFHALNTHPLLLENTQHSHKLDSHWHWTTMSYRLLDNSLALDNNLRHSHGQHLGYLHWTSHRAYTDTVIPVRMGWTTISYSGQHSRRLDTTLPYAGQPSFSCTTLIISWTALSSYESWQ